MFCSKFIRLIIIVLLNIMLKPIVKAQIVNVGPTTYFVSNGPLSLVLKDDGIKNEGNVIAGSGTIVFTGDQFTVNSGESPVTFNNISIKGYGRKSIGNNASITGSLSIRDMSSLDADGIADDKVFTFKSSSGQTARVDEITTSVANAIVGNVTIEQYLQAKRAYRFLTCPVNTSRSIRTNWMENTNNPSVGINNNPMPGCGTQITGTGGDANGFDETGTNNPSLFTFNSNNGLWYESSNTNAATLQAGSGYRIYVRGDRSVDLNCNNPVATPTILRASGQLVTGTVTMTKQGAGGTAGMPTLSTDDNGFSLIGNPYASPINWCATIASGISPNIYFFDPSVSGSNNRGAYVSYNAVLDVNNNKASAIDNIIQQGQAFFVQTKSPYPSITFTEQAKTNLQRNPLKDPLQMPRIYMQLQLPSQLFTSSAADGVSAFFDDNFSNAPGFEDSYKLENPDENICIDNHGQLLSIEGRKKIVANDTMYLKVWQLTQPSYTLRIENKNFDPGLEIYFEDNWKHTKVRLYNDQISLISFYVTTDPASSSSNRFKITFKRPTLLPIKTVNVIAFEKNSGAQVEWTALGADISTKFEVERTDISGAFKTIGDKQAIAVSAVPNTYSFYDAAPIQGDNFYRIRAFDNAGDVRYSNTVKVHIATIGNEIVVRPNPIEHSTIRLFLKNRLRGMYFTNLINKSGQSVYAGSFMHYGGSAGQSIKIDKTLTAGNYFLRIKFQNETFNISLIFK